MQNNQQDNSRRKFVIWTASIVSGLTLLSTGLRFRKKKETVRMLTQDGRLVEIDKRLTRGSKEKISLEKLKNWISRPKL